MSDAERRFTENRYYALAVFISERPLSFRGVTEALGRLSPGRLQLTGEGNADLFTGVWSSKLRFAPDELLEPLADPKRKGVYRYDLVGFSVDLPGIGHAVGVGAPFAKMLEALIDQLDPERRADTQSWDYLRVRLPLLLTSMLGGNDDDGRAVLSNLRAVVSGDPLVKGLTLRGRDALHSKTLEHLRDPAGGLQLVMERCILGYSSQYRLGGPEGVVLTRRVSLHADAFGNFRFWMQKNAKNFRVVPSAFEFLARSGVLAPTSDKPYKRLPVSAGGLLDG